MKDAKKAAKTEENARLEDDCLDQVAGGTRYYLPWGPGSYDGQPAEGAPLFESSDGHYIQVKDEYGMELYQISGEVKEV